MSKYIILTYDICNMGGGQLYVLRRANHLKSRGFEVIVVVAFHDESYFPLKQDFCDVPFYVIPELKTTSSRLPQKKVISIVNDLKNKIGNNENIVIESHTIALVEWGEILAVKYNGKHLAYPLSESTISDYKFNPGRKISLYKLRNNQFYGCNSVALKHIFASKDVPNNYVNIGFHESELADHCVPSLNIYKHKGDFTISTIGRLDKLYIEPLIKGVIKLAQSFPNNSFVLIIAGGSRNQERISFFHNNYNDKSLGQNNLKIVYTGYIKELGKDLFNISDVFVGMGTASINAITQGCLTINIDPDNNMEYASGFFGLDTNNFAYSEDGNVYSICEKLKEAFLMDNQRKNEIISKARYLYEKEFSAKSCFPVLDEIIEKLPIATNTSIIKVSRLYRCIIRCAYWIHDKLKK